MNKKFKVGSIYAICNGYGCGYDLNERVTYVQVVKRTDKSIWVRKADKLITHLSNTVVDKADIYKLETVPMEQLVAAEVKMYRVKQDENWNEYICGNDHFFLSLLYNDKEVK